MPLYIVSTRMCQSRAVNSFIFYSVNKQKKSFVVIVFGWVTTRIRDFLHRPIRSPNKKIVSIQLVATEDNLPFSKDWMDPIPSQVHKFYTLTQFCFIISFHRHLLHLGSAILWKSLNLVKAEWLCLGDLFLIRSLQWSKILTPNWISFWCRLMTFVSSTYISSRSTLLHYRILNLSPSFRHYLQSLKKFTTCYRIHLLKLIIAHLDNKLSNHCIFKYTWSLILSG